MDRVTLLVEERGEQVSCLLNPESLTFRRRAGVRDRARVGSVLVGTVDDDPLLFTGGGATEFEVDLLFDVDLETSTRVEPAIDVPPTNDADDLVDLGTESPKRNRDVRRLTTPIWRLAENEGEPPLPSHPPRVRLIWGKSWNLPCVVVRAAERLERFDTGGTPRRAWLRLHLRQLPSELAGHGRVELPPAVPAAPLVDEAVSQGLLDDAEALGTEVVDALPTLDEQPLLATAGDERADLLAMTAYGAPGWWRWLALVNGIVDPLHIPAGTTLRLVDPPSARTSDDDAATAEPPAADGPDTTGGSDEVRP